MNYIGTENIALLHAKIIEKTGGSPKIRDASAVVSAVMRALATFDGAPLFPAAVDKIAATTHAIIKNHGFVDGNKRTGVAAMLLLLRINFIVIKYSQFELAQLGLAAAEGRLDEKGIAEWIAQRRK